MKYNYFAQVQDKIELEYNESRAIIEAKLLQTITR